MTQGDPDIGPRLAKVSAAVTSLLAVRSPLTADTLGTMSAGYAGAVESAIAGVAEQLPVLGRAITEIGDGAAGAR